MKHILIATALLISASQANAQQTPSATAQPAAVTQDATKQEVRTMSGKLKETYGMVSQQLASVEKQLSVATGASREPLEQAKAELTTTLSSLEGSLTSVNKATSATWKDVSAKAEAVNDEAVALLSRLK
ncbi:MAG: hypothetical protein ABI432_07460 [Flavobacteriales bacterium]